MTHKQAVFFAGALSSLLCGSFLSVMGVLLVRICNDLSITTAQTGILLSSNFAGYMIFTFWGGIAAEKWGIKRTVLAAIAGNLIGAAANLFARALPGGCLGMFLIGGSSGILESMGCALMGSIDKAHSEKYVNLASILVAAGYTVGSGLAGAAMVFTDGWRFVYLILGCFAIVSFTLFLVLVPAQSGGNAGSSSSSVSRSGFGILCIIKQLAQPLFLLTCLCMMFYVGIEVTVFNWLTSYLIEEAGVGIAVSVLTVCFFYLALMAGRSLCSGLLLKWNVSKLLQILPCVSFVSILTVVHVTTLPALIMSAVVLGLMFSSIAPFIVSVGASLGKTTSAYSVIVGFGGVGTVIIPSVVAWIGSAVSIRAGIMCVSPLLLLISLISTFIFRNQHEKKLLH